MMCLSCDNEVTRDYPVCQDCETTAHFTHRPCRCARCEDERAAHRREIERLERVAWHEEIRLQYGRPIEAAA